MKPSTITSKDPICGMAVDTATARHAERDGKTFYFCGDTCLMKFKALPGGKSAESSPKGCCG